MSEFDLLRPYWMLLLVPVCVVFLVIRSQQASAGWAKYITGDKLHWLAHTSNHRSSWFWIWLLATCIAVVAMAGPSWQKLPSPALKNRHGLVIAFDLSDSMLAYDRTPTRLARARLKLIDLLNARRDGETALIAYAADAFQVAPLTDDPKTIVTLVPTLHPDVMPAPGSNTESAVALSVKTLRDAGLSGGDIVLITDGIDPAARSAIRATLPKPFRVSILAVGSAKPVPVPTATGEAMRNAKGEPVMQTMDAVALSTLASNLGGVYTALTDDSTDVTTVSQLNATTRFVATDSEQATSEQVTYDLRRDGGWLLVLLLLPLALLTFQRNVLWLAVLLVPIPEPAQANDLSDWLRTPDQQAMHALNNGNAVRAAKLFKDPRWSVIARFKAGQFESAASTDIPDPTPNDLYNRANAIVMTGALPVAIALYDRVLALDPNHGDARYNRDLADQVWQRIQQERRALLERRRRLKGEEQQTSDEGDEDAPPGPSTQASQVGGPSSDGQTNDQQALNDQGSSSQRSEPRDPNASKPASLSEQNKNDAQRDPARPRDTNNTTLNPYSEQWLRNLKSDPGALMRRKFQFQANRRAREGSATNIPRRY